MAMMGTTICAVKRGNQIAVAGDGQVTMGEHTIFKSTAKKVRRVYNGQVLVGFAGSVADAFSLCERFEEKLVQCGGNLERAAVNLAQEWRGDQIARKLESMLIVADKESLLILSGNFALAAARALVKNTDMSAEDIAVEALNVAASICVYTNDHITVETL